jgi:RNA polymerase sigma factor (TIGR02999 family)
MDPDQPDAYETITSCLVRWRAGQDEALPQLATMVYAELHRLAAVFFREAIDWKCRAQFFSVAARMMRNLLVDHARKRNADKRGGGVNVWIGDTAEEAAYAPDIVWVDAALSRLADRYPRQAQVVELRFFGGLTAEETAETMTANGQEASLRTVERDWHFSKAWLQNELGRA